MGPGSIEWYQDLWGKCKIDSAHLSMVEGTTETLLSHKTRYEAVQESTAVPWQMIGAIHGLESSFNFNTYLGNGDPLNRKTIHVPAGRGPFNSWEAGAIDALTHDGLTFKKWDLFTMLQMGEKYNGVGYLKYHPSHMSPYIWCYTNIQTPGRYVADGYFDPTAVSKQTGMAAYFKQLESLGELKA